ncbi:MAG: YhjD/YihY/BrkB family envelope integrity protein [Planctomycetota bacterium]
MSSSPDTAEPRSSPPFSPRRVLEWGYYGWDQLQRHRAEGMAAELTYRTIFSLVPLVVLGLVTFRIVGGLNEVQSQVENQLYSFFGVPEIPGEYASALDDPGVAPESIAEVADGGLTTSGDSESPPGIASPSLTVDLPATAAPNLPATAAPPSTETEAADTASAEEAFTENSTGEEIQSQADARASIRRTLREVTSKVSSIDFRSIGVFGLLLFIYAAVALADSVEQLFNRIFDAPTGRPIHIRIAIHWSIITLGSGLLAMSLYMSGEVVEWFADNGAGSRGQWMLSHLLSVLASWVLLFLLYALMPNTHVSVQAAAVGALIAACLWETAKFGFQVYVAKALPYSALYGSIGLIPLFLFWIYVTWLIVLFGLILTQALQTFHGAVPSTRTRDGDALPKGDPDWMLPIMAEIARAFESGQVVTLQALADELGLSSRIVNEMTIKLLDHGFVRKVGVGAGDDDGYVLARPAEKITIAEILALAHRVKPTGSHPAWKALNSLKEAERAAAGDQTLAQLSSPPATR